VTGLRAAEYSLSLIKKYWHCGLAVILAVNFALIQIPYIAQKLQSYAISSTEEVFGGRSLAQDQEQKIKDIARKLGVTQTINIRKMNSQALQQFGYHNAFAYFPHIFNIFPVGDQAFMYISEGFFEDLSPEEQDFLIGHELVHIKLGHTKYISVIYLILFILITLSVWQVRKRYSFLRYWMVTIGLWLLFIWMINLGHLFYRRHIERMADMQSLECLGTHTGLLKIVDRWIREYKMPLHNNYYGLFSDHPSVLERKTYCLELQHNHKGS
jgi:Zn-dependent protease with chaperone function